MGRQTTYTEEVASGILERLATGEPLAQICRDEGMPHPSTFREWCAKDEPLAIAYAHAREDGFDAIAVEAKAILDEEPERVIITSGEDRTESRYDSAAVAWAKNRFEGRLKLLAKWDPKRYGDRITHAGDADNPVTVQSIVRKVVDPATGA